MLCGKVRALTEGRFHVAYEDIRAVAPSALRHRVLLNFEAEADRMDADEIVKQVLRLVPQEPVGVGV